MGASVRQCQGEYSARDKTLLEDSAAFGVF